jgi:DNA-binding CsgD family transcriptional regulator
LIEAMAAEGRSPTEIGLRFNLTRRRVQQIIASRSVDRLARGGVRSATATAPPTD